MVGIIYMYVEINKISLWVNKGKNVYLIYYEGWYYVFVFYFKWI